MCLSCCYVGCGRLDNSHILKHGENSGHSVAINLASTMVWCFACDDEVDGGDEVRSMLVEKWGRSGGTKTRGPKIYGIRGISNIGNTCFLAASMQCLNNIYPFVKLFRHSPPYSALELTSVTPQQRLVLSVRQFFLAQWGDPGNKQLTSVTLVSPDEILSSVQRLNALFHGYQQHDSQEFLRFVFNTMHEELRRLTSSDNKVLWSPVSLFMGKTCSTITCLTCKKESKCIEDFYDLSLPIPSEPFHPDTIPTLLSTGDIDKAVTTQTTASTTSWFGQRVKQFFCFTPEVRISLVDCILQFMRTEKLDGQNAYFCEHCKCKTTSLKKMGIESLPEILIFHLKRFRHDGTSWGGSKVGKPVVCGKELDMVPFSKDKYRLVGFVVHMGSLSGGHYIAYCRHKSNGQWHCFDDSRVSVVGDIDAVIEAGEPYVLFYQRVGMKKIKKPVLPCSSGVYLPKRWLIQAGCCSSIPPMVNHDMICPHKQVSTMCPKFSTTQYELVQTDVAKKYISQYGHHYIPPLSLDPCPSCSSSRYNSRLSIEHKLVTKLDTKVIPPGEKWYYIDANWVGRWRHYLRTGAVYDYRKQCAPGKVDNTNLIEKVIKGEIKMSVDFVAVNRSVRNVFVHCHGNVGDVVVCDSLDGSPEIRGDDVVVDTSSWGICDEDIENIACS